MAANKPGANYEDSDADRPPFLRTWRRVYAAVLLCLAAAIAILLLLTRAFST